MMTMLAAAAGSGLSPEVVGGIIAAIIIGLLGGGVLGKKVSDHRRVSINDPIPKIRTQEEPEFVTNDVLNGHLTRIDGSIREMKAAQETERAIARTANGTIHARLDKVMENQAMSRGELTQINLNVQRLLNRTDTKPRA